MEHPKVKKLRDLCREQSVFIDSVTKDMRVKLHEQWKGAGGCECCGGRGWIVTWDTMDSLSGCYAEYGRCPNEAEGVCTKETRERTGMDPSYHSMYDKNKGVRDPLTLSHVANVLLEPLQAAHQKLCDSLRAAEDETTLQRGCKVRVVKGRKVPIGTTGTAFWFGPSKFGQRVGIKDAADVVYWTALDNVVVVLSEDEK
jgi:hypothetical protein